MIDFIYSAAQNEVFFENEDSKFKIIPKGRRVGITLGAAQAYIEWMIDGVTPLLWGDTINGNIDRYVERYFLPRIKKTGIPYNWNGQKRLLRIGKSMCDFRSADRPENWEGFGYRKIFLNEAGIILKNRYLYENAVMPMLLDFPDSQLIAAGVPKGSFGVYYELYRKALKKTPGFYTKTYSSFTNPFLSKSALAELIKGMTPAVFQQEIMGKFLMSLGARLQAEWISDCFEDLDTVNVIPKDIDIAGILIYKHPEKGKSYVLGADPAEGNPNSDDSSLTVLDVDTREEVCQLTRQIEPRVFARHIDEIGRFYNDAAVLVERNNHGHAVLDWLWEHSYLERLNGSDGKPGWLTLGKSKAHLYTLAAETLQDRLAIIHTLETMVQLQRIEANTLKAPDGENDDRAMSWVLANKAASLPQAGYEG